MVKTRAQEDQLQSLVQAARLYYEENLSQEQIAGRLGKSRPTVSRMLAAAKEQGIVRIEIRVPMQRMEALERALVRRLGLVDCRVVVAPRGDPGSVEHLGRAAAGYLQVLLQDGMTVGVSQGRALAATAKYLEPNRAQHLEVVQIIGAMAAENLNTDSPGIARALAKAYEATCRYLHVPLVVDDAHTRDVLMRDRSLAQILQLATRADVALIGIGTLDPRDRSPLFDGLLSGKEASAIRAAGGVGHICGEHFDAQGRRLDIDINNRVVGIGLGALRRIPRVVAMAGGAAKAQAMVAAARGGFYDTLITDDKAAARILQQADELWPLSAGRPSPKQPRPA
ncbi:MAG: sugar-binding transcriptional regulator [Bifidobacteriaceae bacterium]|jgi:DNA-binding transcriptional regulator LsrR (DeoR family)|nr:sugar-binding transcriptional regulator [Bifidobacteriaceae bacterium]